MTQWSATPWRYSLTRNEWLNLPTRRYGMFVSRVSNPRGFNTVYDFTIWSGGKRVAAWVGTESEAFNAMLHMAAHAARERDMHDSAARRDAGDDPAPATRFGQLKALLESGLGRPPVDAGSVLRALLEALRAPTNEMIQEAIERAGLDEDGGDILAADVFRRGYQGAIDAVLADDGRDPD